MSIIISIMPKYSNLIFEGRKTVELRRKIGTKLYIYASSPLKVLYGFATIDTVHILSIPSIRDRFLNKACVSDQDCCTYYTGCAVGYVIKLIDVVEYKNKLTLQELRAYGFSPPQAFCYPTNMLLEFINSIN